MNHVSLRGRALTSSPWCVEAPVRRRKKSAAWGKFNKHGIQTAVRFRVDPSPTMVAPVMFALMLTSAFGVLSLDSSQSVLLVFALASLGESNHPHWRQPTQHLMQACRQNTGNNCDPRCDIEVWHRVNENGAPESHEKPPIAAHEDCWEKKRRDGRGTSKLREAQRCKSGVQSKCKTSSVEPTKARDTGNMTQSNKVKSSKIS